MFSSILYAFLPGLVLRVLGREEVFRLVITTRASSLALLWHVPQLLASCGEFSPCLTFVISRRRLLHHSGASSVKGNGRNWSRCTPNS